MSLLKRKEEIPVPKFNIGQKVFFIKDNKMVEQEILGIFRLYDKSKYHDNHQFKEYVYSFIKSNEIERYDSVPESRAFETRDQLIDSI